jgi:hypothetical protein
MVLKMRRLTTSILIASAFSLIGCAPSAYSSKNLDAGDKAAVFVMDIFAFGKVSQAIVCEEEKGTNHPDCQKLLKQTKENFEIWSGAAKDSLNYHYGSDSSNNGYTTDYDWDWDYQPGNSQWVCRGIQTAQYAELSNCAYDVQDDDRWPN